ncbi:unnamed protein product [Tilletia controversa]|uniref:Origin recognition complex subunit 5 n=1 Tax=Tilletia controversa TaxID=13291 RepID=A0A8X7MYN6_9BASI|nr:hypothetical protein CF328_g3705 [Tilletia controversa]KAE8252868.1 hypothetical protein A4X06_0g1868 [Tilletia controversa]CAD6942505.1 unnamed protein product [Tilletia controversa]CAD7068411.1 unnamed protein product [Tilletia caries]
MSATPDPESIAAAIEPLFPGRSTQISVLAQAYASPEQASPPSLLLYDPRSPRHTSALIRAVLDRIRSDFAQVDEEIQDASSKPALDFVTLPALLVYSPRILFRAVLKAVIHGSGDQEEDAAKLVLDDALDSFVALLANAIRKRTRGDPSQYRLCIVIDQAHRVRDIWPSFLLEGMLNIDTLLRGRGIPAGRVSFILVSHLSWHHYRHADGDISSPGPELLNFPPLVKEAACQTLKLNAKPLYRNYRSASERPAQELTTGSAWPRIHEKDFNSLYSRFCDIAYTSFRVDVADITDMQLLCTAVWHVFLVPVQTGELKVTEFEALLVSGRSSFRDALSRLQSKEVSPGEWISTATRSATLASQHRILEAKLKTSQMPVGSNVEILKLRDAEFGQSEDEPAGGDSEEEAVANQVQADAPLTKKRRIPLPAVTSVPPLPSLSALLLVAAFIACYNPTKLDVSRFVRDETLGPGRKRKKGGGTAKGKASSAAFGSKNSLARQQLIGPKVATLERLLSVFQVLLWESDPETIKEAEEEELGEGLVADSSERQSRLRDVERIARSAVALQRIKALIAQRFLLTTTKLDTLANTSIRINVTYEVAQSLAKQVNMKIEDWLHDWKELF